MAKPKPMKKRNYQAELIDVLRDISKALKSDDNSNSRMLNRASDIRALGNAAVIGLVIEQGLKGQFQTDRAIAGIVVLGASWIISYFVERRAD